MEKKMGGILIVIQTILVIFISGLMSDSAQKGKVCKTLQWGFMMMGAAISWAVTVMIAIH